MNLAEIGLLSYGGSILWALIALVALVVLLRLYTQTRMSGFIWLLFAVVVWPVLARGVSLAMPMYLARQALPTTRMVVTTIAVGAFESIVGGLLLLVAVLVLQRQVTARMLTGQLVTPAVPPTPPTAGYPYGRQPLE